MPKFAANLTMLFTEVPFLERFEHAARAGFRAVEFLFPYDFEPNRILAELDAHRLELVLHNLPAGDWSAGERGIACRPERSDEFRAGVHRAIDYARALRCPRLNCLAGIVPTGASPAEARTTLIENLRFAAHALEAAGLTLLLESVNSRDVPGFFVDRPSVAFELAGAVGAPNLKVQYDIYHAQVMEGDLTRTIERELDRIGHLQVADNPGRHEPGTGEIDYRFLFERIDALGYDGWIGCEYVPRTTTAAGLAWLPAGSIAGAHA